MFYSVLSSASLDNLFLHRCLSHSPATDKHVSFGAAFKRSNSELLRMPHNPTNKSKGKLTIPCEMKRD